MPEGWGCQYVAEISRCAHRLNRVVDKLDDWTAFHQAPPLHILNRTCNKDFQTFERCWTLVHQLSDIKKYIQCNGKITMDVEQTYSMPYKLLCNKGIQVLRDYLQCSGDVYRSRVQLQNNRQDSALA